MKLDRIALEEMLTVTSLILQKYFFYDEESVSRFFHVFTDEMERELICFESEASLETRIQIKHDRVARLYFTIYFASFQIRRVLINYLHFTEAELKAFENLVPKNSEVAKNAKSCSQRAHY